MGLDWMVEARKEGEREISPLETIECPRLDPDDNVTVRHFLKIVESHRSNIHSRGDKDTDYAKHWLRPSDEIIKDHAGDFLVDLIPEKHSAGVASVNGMMTSPIDFRGKVIARMEGLPENLKEDAFADMDPDAMWIYADAIEEHVENVPEEDQPYLKDAIRWLRFWSDKGHGINAWY